MVHRCGTWRGISRALGRVALAAGLLLAAAMPAPAAAQFQDVFTVTDVAVDVTADAAAAARERALAEGQRVALRRLLRRLTLQQDHARLPRLSDAEIVDYVRALEVGNEKTSPVRYLAELTVRFKPDAVRRLLRSAGVPYAETVSKPVVVLPVYDVSGTALLWDEPNPWRQAWSELRTDDALVPLLVPAGDLSDMATISAEQAGHGERDRLEAIARRYGADDVLVAAASLADVPAGAGAALDVAVSRMGPVAEERVSVRRFVAGAEESVDDLLRRAAAEIAAQVEEDWKRDNLLRFGDEQTLSVTVPLGALEDWLKVRRRLQDIPFIRHAELRSLSRGEAVLALRYVGDIAQMTLALAQSDLELSQGATSWILRLQDGGAQNAAR